MSLLRLTESFVRFVQTKLRLLQSSFQDVVFIHNILYAYCSLSSLDAEVNHHFLAFSDLCIFSGLKNGKVLDVARYVFSFRLQYLLCAFCC